MTRANFWHDLVHKVSGQVEEIAKSLFHSSPFCVAVTPPEMSAASNAVSGSTNEFFWLEFSAFSCVLFEPPKTSLLLVHTGSAHGMLLFAQAKDSNKWGMYYCY